MRKISQKCKRPIKSPRGHSKKAVMTFRSHWLDGRDQLFTYLHIIYIYFKFGRMRGRVTSGGCGASWNNMERLIPPGSDAIPLVNPKESL